MSLPIPKSFQHVKIYFRDFRWENRGDLHPPNNTHYWYRTNGWLQSPLQWQAPLMPLQCKIDKTASRKNQG